MNKPAFLFPGQGSHELGMGADLFRSDAWVRDLVRETSASVGEDLERLCLRGPEKRLMRAAFVQPLLVIVSLGYWRRLTGNGVVSAAVAGHSLGEISALAAAGVLTPEHAVHVALERGRLMDEAAARTPGCMAAVSCPVEKVLESLQLAGMADRVFVANDNAPKQTVVSGAPDGIEAFTRYMNAEMHVSVQPLRVSGPWHTPLLREAREKFALLLGGIPLSVPSMPVIMNVTACREIDTLRIRDNMIRQLTERVRWRESMQELKTRGTDRLVEIGPRRVLIGLARLNGFGAETTVCSVDSLKAADQITAS